MNAVLRGLVALACCVVIAGGGYFVWNDHEDRVERDKIAERRDQQIMCDAMLSEFTSGKITHDWRILHVTKCVVEGYLSESDFSKPELTQYLDQARSSIEFARKQQAN